ncbi:MAG: hypothetical protein IPK20_04995 [Betaproteobacteria bacterium]|nr:hypothetical protein [Betaproteobacteria bacterium]
MSDWLPRGGIYVGCALLLIVVGLGLYIGLFEWFGISVLLGFIVAVFACWILARCLWRPSLTKFRKDALPIVVLLGTVALLPFANAAQWNLFLFARRASLEALAKDVIAYGKIQQMSDGLRYHKSLNGQAFDASSTKVGEGTFPKLDEVIRNSGIEPAKYHDFRRRLVAAGFSEFEVTDRYVAFVYDGLLDNLVGVLTLRSTGPATAAIGHLHGPVTSALGL